VTSSRDPVLPSLSTGGDIAARRCMDRYGALVWSLARKYTPSAADAEDAVQDIFVDLWKSAPRFDPARSSEAGFVAMIARRRLVDLRRRRARKKDDEELVEHEVGGSAAVAEERTEVSLVGRALDQLEAKEREVLVLATYEGMTQQEISERVGMPLGTVKTIARRALLRVRAALGGSTAAGALDERPAAVEVER
jgi:RNA polymerase sigma-70 factor (ECF subfamily)